MLEGLERCARRSAWCRFSKGGRLLVVVMLGVVLLGTGVAVAQPKGASPARGSGSAVSVGEPPSTATPSAGSGEATRSAGESQNAAAAPPVSKPVSPATAPLAGKPVAPSAAPGSGATGAGDPADARRQVEAAPGPWGGSDPSSRAHTHPPEHVARAQVPSAHTWLRALYERSARSVVRITTDDGTGSGFFFYSQRHIGTAFHVVFNADFIIVETEGGYRRSARVVAFDEAYDVALLELDEPVPDARVLEAFTAEPFVGMELAVIGHPFSNLSDYVPQFRGLLNWSLTRGVVGAISRSWLQTDAAVNPGNSGGPVFAPDGTVVGLVSAKLTDAQGIGLVVRVGRLLELRDQIGRERPPRPVFTWEKVELGFAVNWAEQPLRGFGLGGGMLVRKRHPLRLRFLFVGGKAPVPDPSVLSRELDQFAFELDGGYGVYRGGLAKVAVTGGLALHLDDYEDLSYTVSSSTNCGQATCPLQGRAGTKRTLEVRALPMLGASVDLWMLRVVYAYQFDVTDIEASQHRAIFALAF